MIKNGKILYRPIVFFLICVNLNVMLANFTLSILLAKHKVFLASRLTCRFRPKNGIIHYDTMIFFPYNFKIVKSTFLDITFKVIMNSNQNTYDQVYIISNQIVIMQL